MSCPRTNALVAQNLFVEPNNKDSDTASPLQELLMGSQGGGVEHVMSTTGIRRKFKKEGINAKE